MKITHFIVPAAAYPRYRYTKEHVAPLLKHFRQLTQKCNISDPFSIPDFGDVNIYTISDADSEILTVDEISPRCTTDIQRTSIICKDVGEFRHHCQDLHASVHVASYQKANQNGKEGENIFDYFGRYNVIVTEKDEYTETTSPEIKSVDDSIICLKAKKKFSMEMGLLLERIVLRELYKRVKVLAAFIDLDPAGAVFATLDQDIENILRKKFEKSRSFSAKRPVSATERDVIHLHDEWCTARLQAIETKIRSLYGKHVAEVRDQLLEPDADNSKNGRKIQALKICEHIIPHLQLEILPSESRQIPESLLEQITVLKSSEETTREAIRLEERFQNHLDQVQQHNDEIKQLYGESMGVYHRSRVPEYERPQRLQKKPPILSKDVAKDFLSIDGVTGCGYRFQTLDIYVKETLTTEEHQNTEARVKETTEIHGISEYKIRIEQGTITQFADYGVGSTVTTRLERSGSLGGFANMGETQELSLLVARHLADDGKPLYVRDNGGNKSVIAYVLEAQQKADRFGSLDIAAAKVLRKVKPNCMTMFKDHYGSPLASKLTFFEELDIEWLKGLPVHIWGAASSPGLGKIVIPDFYVEGMKRLVKIEDRHPVDTDTIVPFSQSGDSGAIVCADDHDGEIVHVISMIMGSSNFNAKEENPAIKGEYLSIRLKDGLLQLEQEHKDIFKLC